MEDKGARVVRISGLKAISFVKKDSKLTGSHAHTQAWADELGRDFRSFRESGAVQQFVAGGRSGDGTNFLPSRTDGK